MADNSNDFIIIDGVLYEYKGSDTEITIPEEVEHIVDECFREKNITKITMGNNVKTLGQHCFDYCQNLKEITLSESLTELPEYCFYYCNNLTNIKLPNSIVELGNYCFNCCDSINKIEFSNNLKKIGTNCFSSCQQLTSLVLPDSLETMGCYCFFNCTSLQKVTIPYKITSLPISCFDSCSNLIQVTFNGALRVIGTDAFNDCNSLKYIKLPNTVIVCYIGAFSKYDDNDNDDNYIDNLTIDYRGNLLNVSEFFKLLSTMDKTQPVALDPHVQTIIDKQNEIERLKKTLNDRELQLENIRYKLNNMPNTDMLLEEIRKLKNNHLGELDEQEELKSLLKKIKENPEKYYNILIDLMAETYEPELLIKTLECKNTLSITGKESSYEF